MTIKHRHQIKVSIRWEGPTRPRPPGKDKERQARLRWRETDGTRHEKRIGWATLLEAEQARAKRQGELHLGVEQPDSSKGLDVASMLALYTASVEESPTSKGHKDRVAVDCENVGRHLGDMLVDSLNSTHVGKYLAHRSRECVVRARQKRGKAGAEGETDDAWDARRLAARTKAGKPVSSTAIRNELATLRRAMTWAKDAGHTRALPVSPPPRNAMPDDARPPRMLMESEARRLIDAAGPDPENPDRTDHRLLVQMFAWSGRRPVAIFGLRVKDCLRVIDDSIPRRDRLAYFDKDKGGRSRGWGPLTEPAYEAIRARMAELGPGSGERFLWTKDNGKPWASTDWPKAFRWIAKRAGVEGVVTYDLRKHACAQLLRQLHGNAAEAIKYSGHKTVEVFMRNYAYAIQGGEVPSSAIGWSRPALRLVETESED